MSYQLTLLFEDRVERVPAPDAGPHAIGDEIEAEGMRWEVIGLLWDKDEERLLCRPLKDVDQAVSRERTWWSTEWH